jgi:hypothetical protein
VKVWGMFLAYLPGEESADDVFVLATRCRRFQATINDLPQEQFNEHFANNDLQQERFAEHVAHVDLPQEQLNLSFAKDDLPQERFKEQIAKSFPHKRIAYCSRDRFSLVRFSPVRMQFP